jgi:hypothetical protein
MTSRTLNVETLIGGDWRRDDDGEKRKKRREILRRKKWKEKEAESHVTIYLQACEKEWVYALRKKSHMIAESLRLYLYNP